MIARSEHCNKESIQPVRKCARRQAEGGTEMFVISKPRGSVMMTDEYKVCRKYTWLPRSELDNARGLLRKSDIK